MAPARDRLMLGEDGVFLIDVAGAWTGGTPRRWTRVKLTGRWDLAGVLGERPGEPEFVTLSMDGDILLGVTTEEDEVWLIAVDRRPGERQEEWARSAARGSPEERAAAWASLVRGPGPSERLRDVWAQGLGLNPAIPDELLAGLLGRSPFLLWRHLPAAVVDAAVAHPDWSVRGRPRRSRTSPPSSGPG
ncbi:hypothetical protein [Streptomyces sp. CB03238]|uniref:hypothetical protein n=1 Tax=Streptomyces sp. CB03238 TaxID=1907777 RepID=UPI000A10D2EA|nr:hypothetical protein [Streptomyces sp. CB03238]ORT55604.1 hypothetical protein BKD26_31330 [Streptomyces sp. CB03238]